MNLFEGRYRRWSWSNWPHGIWVCERSGGSPCLDDPPSWLLDSDFLITDDVDAWLEQGLRLCPCHALVEQYALQGVNIHQLVAVLGLHLVYAGSVAVLAHEDVLDLDGLATIRPEASDVNVAEVKGCACPVLFQGRQFYRHFALAITFYHGGVTPVAVLVEEAERRTARRSRGELYHDILIAREVYRAGVLPAAEAVGARGKRVSVGIP